MMCDVLDPKTAFSNVPYGPYGQLIEGLSIDNKWRKVGEHMITFFGNHVLRSSDLRVFAKHSSPAESLLKKFCTSNIIVRDVQFTLWRSHHEELLDCLITNDRVEITDPEEDVNIERHVGQPLKLTVSAFGSPYPQFQWFHNGGNLNNQNSDILILSVFRKSDEGCYSCQVTQSIANTNVQLWSPRFFVNAKKSSPVVVPGKDLQDVKLKEKEDLVFKFEVVAEPEEVTYIWYKDGKVIVENQFNTYKVNGAGLADAGVYCCKAKNSEGSCESNEINVDVTPSCSAPGIPIIIKKPHEEESRSLGDGVDTALTVRCRHNVTFACFVNAVDYKESLSISQPSENYLHTCILRYEVNQKDWTRGDHRPIIIQFVASSKEGDVSCSVKINVKRNCDERTQYTARNKYAMLIANSDYRKEMSLKTPVKDMEAFSKVLIKLDFRCFIYRNVTQSELLEGVNLFSDFIQPEDYVVFYYAGHGYHGIGVDYMMPLNAKKHRIGFLDSGCVALTEVLNRFQAKDPALLFTVLDCCRDTTNQDVSQKPPTLQKTAKNNSYTIFATSESYTAYEVEDGSLVVENLLELIAKPIPVIELGQQFMKAFEHSEIDEDHRDQIPRIDYDLRTVRSLADPCVPHKTDESTVHKDWEKMSDVGGTKCQKVKVEDDVVEVKISPEQKGCPMVISNCIDIHISVSLLNCDKKKLIKSKGWKICITIDSCDKTTEKDVTEGTITIPVSDLQAIRDDLWLSITFKKEENIVGETRINLGMLSLCNIRNFR